MEKIKIFILTLQKEQERQKYMADQFLSKGLNYEYFFGKNGKELTKKELNLIYDRKKCEKYSKRELTLGEIGCALSHKLLYSKIVEENIDRAIILEDDVLLTDDFVAIIKKLVNIKINNYVIKLERPCTGRENKDLIYTPWGQIKLTDEYKIVFPLTSVFSTCAYYIDKIAAQTMLKNIPRIFLTADSWNYYRKYIRLRILNRNIVEIPELFDSIIEHKTLITNGEQWKLALSVPVKVINLIQRVIFSK